MASEYRVNVYRVKLVRDGTTELPSGGRTLRSPYDAAELARLYLDSPDREHLVEILLDVRQNVIGVHTIAIGTLTACTVNLREVFKAAIVGNAAAIMLIHNHPSGDPTPSAEDLNLTREIASAGKLLDIPLIDHVVIGDGTRFYSLKEHGQV